MCYAAAIINKKIKEYSRYSKSYCFYIKWNLRGFSNHALVNIMAVESIAVLQTVILWNVRKQKGAIWESFIACFT